MHKTNVLGIDPFRRNLRQVARERGFDISEAPYEGFDILGSNKCAFLGVEGKDNACSVYNIRPLICMLFPFIMQRMESLDLKNGDKSTMEIIMLTTACPPLKEAKAQGVTYVGIDEIIRPEIIHGRKALVCEMPILGDIFLNILRNRMDRGLFDLNKVLEINGRGVLPIG
jgi:Fe-S-cluster containining protein